MNSAVTHPAPALSGTPEFRQIEQAFHSLLRAYGRLRQVMDPYFARFGISASQWAILRNIHRAEVAGQPCLRLTDLGQRLLIQPPSVTTVVDRLERHGLLERQQVKSDQRVRLVALTPAGRELVTTVLKGHAAQVSLLFCDHNPEEVKLLAELLQKLEKRLSALAVSEQGSVTARQEQNGLPQAEK